jgi:hypothetical protein
MNAFVNGMNPVTENGAKTLGTSNDVSVDLFAIIGSARIKPDQAVTLFKVALAFNPKEAIRILLWARDCRGGAGERKIFELCVQHLFSVFSSLIEPVLDTFFHKVVEIGRYDDLFVFLTTDWTRQATAQFLKNQLEDPAVSKLVAKWLPREKSANKNIAKILMKEWGMGAQAYRKLLVSNTDVVEQKMCAKQYQEIEYSHVPSLAMSRYGAAFGRNDQFRFAEYKESLVKGDVVAKATSLYPHDLVRSCPADPVLANEQWKQLTNYIPAGVSILPIVDVSGSMQCQASGSITCMQIAIALGLYLSEKQTSAFKDVVLTFHTSPSLIQLKEKNLMSRINEMVHLPWGGSTDFVKSMELVLIHAVRNRVPAEEMPQYIICCSDMQFNIAASRKTNFEHIKDMFESAGYAMPKLIFWQLNGKMNNLQTTADTENVAMISGFSPSIMEAVLSGNSPTPRSVMEAAIYKSRYDIKGLTV